jgi:fructose-bisphosphate aldolase class I
MSYYNEMKMTCQQLTAPYKGILAADESIGTIGKRFANINVENNHENRMKYRNLLFTTPNLERNISGVITFEETLFDTREDEIPLVQSLLDKGIVVGIKTDKGVVELPGTDGETVTQGIDHMKVRCEQYYQAGARFAKWRAVLRINEQLNQPSELAIDANAYTLARYAAISQQCGLVPIVEPEILMDGNHSFEESYDVSRKVLRKVYDELVKHHVKLDCTLLKPNMVRCGVDCKQMFDAKKIGYFTNLAFSDSIPNSVPGVVFLSGGMSEQEASEALDEINKQNQNNHWRLTFSYGRALQASVLKEWDGKDENIEQAQKVLLQRAKCNGLASMGEYESEEITGESLYEKNYSY